MAPINAKGVNPGVTRRSAGKWLLGALGLGVVGCRRPWKVESLENCGSRTKKLYAEIFIYDMDKIKFHGNNSFTILPGAIGVKEAVVRREDCPGYRRITNKQMLSIMREQGFRFYGKSQVVKFIREKIQKEKANGEAFITLKLSMMWDSCPRGILVKDESFHFLEKRLASRPKRKGPPGEGTLRPCF